MNDLFQKAFEGGLGYCTAVNYIQKDVYYEWSLKEFGLHNAKLSLIVLSFVVDLDSQFHSITTDIVLSTMYCLTLKIMDNESQI